jgi:hypothetical protein
MASRYSALNEYELANMIHHLVSAELGEPAVALLTGITFYMAITASGNTTRLLDDASRVLQAPLAGSRSPSDARSPVS